MYRELLTPYFKENLYASLQEPCPEEQIEKAEQAVGLPFPKELKDLLCETNGDHWLLLSADEIAENARLNRKCFEEAEEDEKALWEPLNHLLLFAANGCGDYYGYLFSDDGSAKKAFICGSMRTFSIKRLPKILSI